MLAKSTTGLLLALAAFATQAAQVSVVRASEMLGMQVRNSASGDTGRIRDLAIDLPNNRVHYAVLDMPGKLLTVAPERLDIAPGTSTATFSAAEERPIESRPRMELRRATNLIDREVTNEPGERVGRLRDLVIDPSGGSVLFAVLELERPAGDGTLHAVPLDGFADKLLRESLVMTFDRKRLDRSHGLTAEQLRKGLADADFVRRQARYADRLTPDPGG